MIQDRLSSDRHKTISRRRFVQAGVTGLAGLAACRTAAVAAPAAPLSRRPNFVLIITDQLSLDAISGHGCSHVRTPNIDRLLSRGVSFLESHSTSPVCSPARSSIFTGRMPVETGVVTNNLPIHPSRPNLGKWLSQHGYETVYCGKWHLPGDNPSANGGFRTLPTVAGQGDLKDPVVSRSCQAFLHTRSGDTPFLLVSSLLNPHDICFWSIMHQELVPRELPLAALAGRLPPLPPNNKAFPKAPAALDKLRFEAFNEQQWRYYLWVYYRLVETVDAEIGRVLAAIEDSGQSHNTIIALTADHGEGSGRHSHVQKWYPYEEAVKVPLIFSCPGQIPEGRKDQQHLVSGLDIMSTFCDYAGVAAPAHARGRSVRPLLEGKQVPWREFVVSDWRGAGHMLRTGQYKYVRYSGDPVEQLFDMKADPWEMNNLCDEAKYADVIRSHRRLLDEWEAGLERVAVPQQETQKRRKA